MDAYERKSRGRGFRVSFILIALGACNLYSVSPSLSWRSFQVREDVFSLSNVALSRYYQKDDSLRNQEHIVFIGDSIIRYSFLEWLDQKHYMRQEGEYATPELINEKLSESWYSYFVNSTSHFQGNMYCDCRRSQNHSLSSETENRYYRTDSLWVTYLQGCGDNQAHGRVMPLEVNMSVISRADGPDKDKSPYKWGYIGRDWDQLIANYVSEFQRKPTAIVLNAGFWPNDGISDNLGNILGASRNVMGDKGIVVWRGMTKMRDSRDASLSPADVSARDWSYRLPWLSYQAFPKLNLSASDYFDELHFSNPKVYREWNAELSRGFGSAENPKHRVFIFVGAIRTLRLTEKSILRNLVYPICSPPTCIAHLVIHFSYSDNRPSIRDDDPAGTVVSNTQNTSQANPFDQWEAYFPVGFLFIHKVDEYDIGSPEEQVAMDTLESEMDPLVAARMRMFRIGDPRRYSYWIARAWAWRYTQQLSKSADLEFDFYAFARPDLLWIMPVSTRQFFDDFKTDEKEAWVHDTYVGHVADTFAFLPSYESADVYFSIPPLLETKVACLGGPNFNKTIVRNRLITMKIPFNESDWCTEEVHYLGWSEKILLRKLRLAKVAARLYPAATVIVRPPSQPDCGSLHVRHLNGFATYTGSHVPGVACLAVEQRLRNGDKDIGLPSRPFRLRSKNRDTSSTCLALNTTTSSLVPAPCKEYPYPPEQIFVEINDTTSSSVILYGYTVDQHEFDLVLVNDKPLDLEELWSFEQIELYSSRTFDPKK